MLKKRISIILGALLFLVFILALFALAIQKETPVSKIVEPKPTPTITIVPTVPMRPDQLAIIAALPSQSTAQPYLPTQKITLIFNDPITPGLLKYEVSPNIPIDVFQGKDKNTLLIFPKNSWGNGQTMITILQSTKSVGGKSLFSPFIYYLLTGLPDTPELEYLGFD